MHLLNKNINFEHHKKHHKKQWTKRQQVHHTEKRTRVENILLVYITIEKNWCSQNFDFLSFKNLSPYQFFVSSNSGRYHWKYPSRIFDINTAIIYEKIVYWKKNVFLLSGQAGQWYIYQTTILMNEWLHEWLSKNIIFKTMMIIPSLLLQEASKNLKSKDHLKALERPVELWDSRQLLDLLKEAETNSRSF